MAVEQGSRKVGRSGAVAITVIVLVLTAGVVWAVADRGPTRAHATVVPTTTRTVVSSAAPTRTGALERSVAPAHATSSGPITRQSAPRRSAPRPTAVRRAPERPRLLWPFTTQNAVLQWEAAYREGGHQPWHTSACDTGELYARYVLALANPTVDTCTVRGDQAWVRVTAAEQQPPTRRTVTIHLLRVGNDPGGWVVTGHQ